NNQTKCFLCIKENRNCTEQNKLRLEKEIEQQTTTVVQLFKQYLKKLIISNKNKKLNELLKGITLQIEPSGSFDKELLENKQEN
ncbi:22330_t:CDS:1, partial [Racocetra persica]